MRHKHVSPLHSPAKYARFLAHSAFSVSAGHFSASARIRFKSCREAHGLHLNIMSACDSKPKYILLPFGVEARQDAACKYRSECFVACNWRWSTSFLYCPVCLRRCYHCHHHYYLAGNKNVNFT